MMESRRIVHIISSLAVGGAQRHLLDLLTDPSDCLHQDVIYFRDHDLCEEAKQLAGHVYHIPMASYWGGVMFPRLVAIIASGQYDVVHTHLLRADMYGALAARLARTPALLATKHNMEERLEQSFWRCVHRRMARMPDITIAISEAVKAWAVETAGSPPAKTRVVYYGIDAGRFVGLDQTQARTALGVDQNARVMLCPARLDPQKNHGMLLRAFEVVLREVPDAVLLISGSRQLGSEQYERDLHALGDILGVSENVRWIGVQSDIKPLLAACDVVAMASEWEGFGLALLEAIAAARPVVATAVGGVPEVICHGETGMLVESGRTDQFAQALIQILCDDPGRRRMGFQGQQQAGEMFTLARMRAAIQALYSEALDRGGSQPSFPSPI